MGRGLFWVRLSGVPPADQYAWDRFCDFNGCIPQISGSVNLRILRKSNIGRTSRRL